MDNYWTSQHDQAIREYFAATCDCERNRIIDQVLHIPLFTMAKRGLVGMGVDACCEYQQDIVIHLIYKVLPKLTEDKLQGALQYLWRATNNYIITYILNEKKYNHVSLDGFMPISDKEAEDVEDMNIYMSASYVIETYLTPDRGPSVEPVDLDAPQSKAAIHKKIIDEIDVRLKGQHIVNTTNSVFLLLLKQYILDNDFDVRGFGAYVMDAMHLKLSTYRAIAGRLGLRTKDFNEKLIK